ncbi:hypothetical protein AD006_12385 [Pseudonocardia sp. EC080610-09]|uniref:hypothetical protein n=1 Tax=unclassified Pseudonocardia TaxID=2619320 RepID=UPI0006CB2AA7|nr:MULTISPECIES: hypothetical protein [unclassified Pseudonocardia]ALE72590.1 hypothetical protein FRP1_04740 [Pseudonocardia sp. EC080625-04]ALL75904.1 hypothetical protein AD006_12385 [Pseudonocardia sp. EC080610-09]ALL82931.1 hypothetical protein AD017_20215 [Pseudonocardia sp. EC080619-01]
MRTLAIDQSRTKFIYSGLCVPKSEYVQLSDGSTKRSGNQASNDEGVPLWTMDTFVDDENATRAEAIGITVPSYDEPKAGRFQSITFQGLVATIYTDRNGQPAVSLKATGIDQVQQKPAPADKAA